MARHALALLWALATSPAWAGSSVATPALQPPTGGSLHCFVSNASPTKTIEVEWGLYDFDGDVVFGPITSTLSPLENTQNSNDVMIQAACVARVTKGGKSSLRIALTAEDSGGNVVAAVEGR
jgi:hypothetical protein